MTILFFFYGYKTFFCLQGCAKPSKGRIVWRVFVYFLWNVLVKILQKYWPVTAFQLVLAVMVSHLSPSSKCTEITRPAVSWDPADGGLKHFTFKLLFPSKKDKNVGHLEVVEVVESQTHWKQSECPSQFVTGHQSGPSWRCSRPIHTSTILISSDRRELVTRLPRDYRNR